MKKITAFAAILAMTTAIPAFAQDGLTGVEALDDRIDDITEIAQEDLDRGTDAERYSALGVPQGFRGSAALTASGTSGNTDTADLSFAGRVTYGVGEWSHSAGFAGEFGESDGDRDEEKLFATYEGSRAFSEKVYAYGTGRFEYDGFATNERDAFVGIGAGYRIVNTPDFAWRVQAGPGIRYTELNTDVSETDTAGLFSSRFYYGLTDAVSVTNDTDVLASDINTIATNDFGVNFKVTDTLSTRISYRTDFNDSPLPGRENTDNTVGLSLVVGF